MHGGRQGAERRNEEKSIEGQDEREDPHQGLRAGNTEMPVDYVGRE